MAIRYQNSGFSIDGNEYQISIFDTSYSGAIVSDFITDNSFFKLRYSAGDENYSPIMGSELTLNIVLAKYGSRDDTTLFNFLKSMVAQNSQLYYIIIKEKISGTWVNYWRGNVVQNQSAWKNDSLEGGKVFSITANDFAYLKDKPYTEAVDYSGSLRHYINKCLLKLGLYDDYTSGITLPLQHNINWFPSVVTVGNRGTTDTLTSTATSNTNFKELSQDRTKNTINYIDIIKTICQIFGTRIIQSNGKYWIIQLSNYNHTSVKFYARDLQNNNDTSFSINPKILVDNSDSNALKILEGGQYTAERPYYRIKATKPRLNSHLATNPKDNFDQNPFLCGASNILISGGHNNCINVGLNIFTANPVRRSIVSIVLDQELKIKTSGGTWYYLANLGTTGKHIWQTTSTTFTTTIPYPNNYVSRDKPIIVDLKTPELPTFEFIEVQYSLGAYITSYIVNNLGLLVINTSYNSNKGNISIDFLENGTYGEETTYSATLSPTPFDTIEKEIDKVLLYDSSDGSPKGKISVYNGATWANSLDWAIGTSTDYFKLLELMVLAALAQNSVVKESLEATIRGTYYPHQLITYDDKQWHLQDGEFNAAMNEWKCTFKEVLYNDTNAAIDTVTSPGNWNDNNLT